MIGFDAAGWLKSLWPAGQGQPNVIDRRAFLIATASAASIAAAPAIASHPAQSRRTIRTPAPFAAQALTIARRITAAIAGDFSISIEGRQADAGSLVPRNECDIVFGTLDALADHHPGFAYYAGLPGALGMPDAVRLRWMATDGGKLWRDLQDQTGFTCLVTGTTRRGADLWSSRPITSTGDLTSLTLRCAGVTATVLNGLGVNTSGAVSRIEHRPWHGIRPEHHAAMSAGFDRHGDRPYCVRNGIAQHGRTLAIVMHTRAWEHLSRPQRAALETAAVGGGQQAFGENGTLPSHVYLLPIDIANARDRVAEAVLADLSSHDVLTERINRSYFAACRNLTS